MNLDVLYFFIIPEIIALGILVYHSLKTRGLIQTLVFGAGGFIYFTVKENYSAAGLFPHGGYKFSHSLLKINDAPLFVIIGWLFAAYLSLLISTRLMEHLKIDSKNIFVTCIFIWSVTESIAYAIETCGVSARWWDWMQYRSTASPEEKNYYIYGLYQPLTGWPRFVIIFLAPYLYFLNTENTLSLFKKIGYMLLVQYLLFYSVWYIFHFFPLVEFLIESCIAIPALLSIKKDIVNPYQPRSPAKLKLLPHAMLIASCAMMSVVLISNLLSGVALYIYISVIPFLAFLTLSLIRVPLKWILIGFGIPAAIVYVLELPYLPYAFLLILTPYSLVLVRVIIAQIFKRCNRSIEALGPRLLKYVIAGHFLNLLVKDSIEKWLNYLMK